MGLACWVLHGHFEPDKLFQVSKMMMKNNAPWNDFALETTKFINLEWPFVLNSLKFGGWHFLVDKPTVAAYDS